MSGLTRLFGFVADDIIAAQAELNSLDAVAGDGDLGLTMTTAAEAVKALLPEETRALRPRVGRASWLADRSEGHEDGGAHLVALVFASATRSGIAAPR